VDDDGATARQVGQRQQRALPQSIPYRCASATLAWTAMVAAMVRSS
jgi:hypothetical protein